MAEMHKGNKQVRQFGLFIAMVAVGSSLAYHTLNRDWVDLASARRRAAAGRYAEAAAIYNRLAGKNFQPESVYRELAECYLAMGQPQEARETWFYILAHGLAEGQVAMRKLAATALWLGRYDEAEKEFRVVLSMTPSDRAARVGLARALAWSGQYEEAIREYRALLGDKR